MNPCIRDQSCVNNSAEKFPGLKPRLSARSGSRLVTTGATGKFCSINIYCITSGSDFHGHRLNLPMSINFHHAFRMRFIHHAFMRENAPISPYSPNDGDHHMLHVIVAVLRPATAVKNDTRLCNDKVNNVCIDRPPHAGGNCSLAEENRNWDESKNRPEQDEIDDVFNTKEDLTAEWKTNSLTARDRWRGTIDARHMIICFFRIDEDTGMTFVAEKAGGDSRGP